LELLPSLVTVSGLGDVAALGLLLGLLGKLHRICGFTTSANVPYNQGRPERFLLGVSRVRGKKHLDEAR
jgi:hypothetical protein